ncbi:MAG: archease [Candidatus Eisenbacteria sp.]|nr:archease [Candidatus Eisenbacteria bacterium]
MSDAKGMGREAKGMGRDPEGFEPVDHTADLGLRVWAEGLEGLFRQAALGLSQLLTDPARIRVARRLPIEVTGADLEELLVSWLNEILYRAESEGMLFAEFQDLRIEETAGGYSLAAVALGEPRDESRHPLGAAVKAATYHGLEIESRSESGYDLTIILDT